jgi:hypothetical protein
MAIVFQYGSNMSVARLNCTDCLAGDAKLIGVARTVESYELAFTVWSKTTARQPTSSRAPLVETFTEAVQYSRFLALSRHRKGER